MCVQTFVCKCVCFALHISMYAHAHITIHITLTGHVSLMPAQVAEQADGRVTVPAVDLEGLAGVSRAEHHSVQHRSVGLTPATDAVTVVVTLVSHAHLHDTDER